MGYGLWVMGYGLWVMGYGLRVMGYGLWVMGYGLWVTGYGLRGFNLRERRPDNNRASLSINSMISEIDSGVM